MGTVCVVYVCTDETPRKKEKKKEREKAVSVKNYGEKRGVRRDDRDRGKQTN